MKKSGLINPRSDKPPPLVLTTPNYMKSTTSSDARKLSLKMMNSPCFKPARTLVKKCTPSAVVLCENLDVKRATRSTTLKDCKFPAYLGLSPGGTGSKGASAMKVCPYNYCSLKGHCRAPLPPLKCFILARRHDLKTQRSVKMVCLSPRPMGGDPSFGEKHHEEDPDFFVEIYDTEKEDTAENLDRNATEIAEEVSPPYVLQEAKMELLSQTAVESMLSAEVDSESSDMDWEIDQSSPLYLDDDDEYEYTSEMEKKQDIINAEFMIKLENKLAYYSDEVPKDEVSQESFNAVSLRSSDDTLSTSGDHEVRFSNVKTSVPVVIPEEPETAREEENEFLFSGNQDDAVKEHNQTENSKTESTNMDPGNKSTSVSTQEKPKFKKFIEKSDEPGHFNPQAPTFLALEPEPEAEKVDLRHQELGERKRAEEWMVDYALRQAVTKLAPSRKRKVAMLVEAFEKVMPTTKCQLHPKNGSVFHHATPIQACS